MQGQENVELVRAGIAAFNANDMEGVKAKVAADVMYTIRGRASVSGVYHGVEDMAAALSRVKDLTGGTMVGTPEVVLANDEHVLMYMHVTGSRADGRTYDSHQAYRYRVRDGKIVEGETIPVDQHAFAEFMA